MLVTLTILLRNGLTDFYEILFAYSVGLRIGYYLFFITQSDLKKNGETIFAGSASIT